MRRGFTLLELLVVIAMIILLMAVIGGSVAAAHKRALIARAQGEAQEITNAILAYANYTKNGTLSELTGRLNDAEATESSLDFLLGKKADVPILYNAAISGGGKILDPWGHPYRVTVKKGVSISPPGVPSMSIRLFYPNWHRLGVNE